MSRKSQRKYYWRKEAIRLHRKLERLEEQTERHFIVFGRLDRHRDNEYERWHLKYEHAYSNGR